MIIRAVVVSVFNMAILSINLFTDKLHKWLFKTSKKHYEAFKFVVSICCPIVTLLITASTSIISIITASETESKVVGFINLGVGVLILIVKLFHTFNTFLKKELEKEEYKSFNGVFAVSAIIITKDQRFLLVKRKGSKDSSNLWVQPGVYYRTNTLHKEPPPLLSFFNHLIKSLESECGLTSDRYTPIKLNSIIEKECPTFDGTTFQAWTANYNRNKLSQTPFLIQDEKGEVKERSGTLTHIDSFYAFQLEITADELLLQKMMPSDAKYEQVATFTFEEIEQMCKNTGLYKDDIQHFCYPDLVVIIDKFLKVWRRELFVQNFKRRIRHCTFNPNKHTIWLRLNDNCNLNCQFCLLKDKKRNTQTRKININAFGDFWNQNLKFEEQIDYHLVVTGGEPLLNDKLYEVIEYIDEHSNGCINSITICTNGTLGAINGNAIENITKMFDDDCSFKNKLKFVINMASYNQSTFRTITCTNDSSFSHQCKFIKTLQQNGINNITANVVMTDVLKQNLNDYFLFWKRMNIKNIAFSYSIQLGIQARNIKNSIKTLSKSECIKLYNSLENGAYPIESFENIELMIPSCDEKGACKENRNIISCIDKNNDDNWEIFHGCLDI